MGRAGVVLVEGSAVVELFVLRLTRRILLPGSPGGSPSPPTPVRSTTPYDEAKAWPSARSYHQKCPPVASKKWLPDRDSNPDNQDQSLASYH